MQFPQNLVDEYNIHKNFEINIIKWYNKFIESSIEENDKEEALTIWSTKKVHRDSANGNYIEYRGQFKKRNKDAILNELINERMSGYYFVGNSLSHECYEITHMEMTQVRTLVEPPKYRVYIKKIEETDVIKNKFPEYYNNTYRHPKARIKLTSLAKYGFVPRTTDKLDSGIIEAYKIIM